MPCAVLCLTINSHGSSYTYMHEHVSDVTAHKLLWSAINDALLELDAARQALRKYPGDKS